MSDLFENAEIISAYTWDNAIEDGTFVRVPDEDGTFVRVPEELSKQAGIKFPTAVTANLYNTYIKTKTSDEKGRLWDVLWMMRFGKMEGNMSVFTVKLGRKNVELWAVCEARNPINPEPIVTIMLKEDR